MRPRTIAVLIQSEARELSTLPAVVKLGNALPWGLHQGPWRGLTRANRALRAASVDGAERLVHESPGSLTILDVAADGRVLINREDERMAMVGVPPGGASERELSWFDDAGVASLSRDGHTLLFGDRFGIYLRPTDGSPAAKLGGAGGWADELSPDGRLVLTTSQSGDQVVLVPTGPGRSTTSMTSTRFFRSLQPMA